MRLNARGMTLIEIMIVVAIIGGMMALAVTILVPGNEQKVQDETVKLAGTIKYLFDEAAVKNRYFRVVFNIDDRTYRVESSTEPFLVALEDDEKKSSAFDRPAATGEPQGSPDAEGFTEESEDILIQPVKLPSGVKYKDILVMHANAPQDSGTVYLYFFPNGYVEPVIVNLTDDDEETVYSLEVNPLTGKAKIRDGYYEMKEGSLRPEATP